MTNLRYMCWDSCVIIRYLTKSPPEYVDDVEDFIKDAQNKHRTIFVSTIAIAEIRPSFLKQRGYGSANEFFEDFQGAFELVSPDPNILASAAELKDAVPTDPGTLGRTKRRIGTPDAIHLTTCLYVRDALGYRDVTFHTFDKGKGETWEGRCVPLIGFEHWFPSPAPQSLVADVCSLSRLEPLHPQPRLKGIGKAAE